MNPGTGNSKSRHDSTQLSINDKCKLLNWEGTSEVVARGHISDIHPESKVHGYKLGPNCYRIAIEEVVMPDVVFYRSQPEFVTMEDAPGSTVAWPIKYILCDN
ncbi:putative transposase, Tnp1/En/Spm [Rosa chinensis]|uniref:Putative transposase, Tnp1/En/Spm n=1 Tax=Rosa chinensis TaxID=74649 RepID=A0A2P6SQD5_ROSCH|nr:putative transposase, Tnp1/En/Spm [Rosa chinensis]